MKSLKVLSMMLLLAVSALVNSAFAQDATTNAPSDFTFVQLSDIHYGFNDPKINPDYAGTLQKAVDAVNKLDPQPDFVVITGDLTHRAKTPDERMKRMSEVRTILSGLKVKDVRFNPGEHDADQDNGEAFKEFFGNDTYYSFDHKGAHIIVLNTTEEEASLGDAQLQWLQNDLSKLDKDNAHLVVFTHRPLFDLYPKWGWSTKDGQQALDMLMPFKQVTIFYGHIHQLNEHMTGHIDNYAAAPLMFALPAPGSQPKSTPVPWDPAHPYKNIGFRSVLVKADTGECVVTEHSLADTLGN